MVGKVLHIALLAAVTLSGLTLTRCTGGVGGAVSPAAVALTGVVSAGPVSGAAVSVFELAADGARARSLGSALTDANGVFRIDVVPGAAPLEVVVTGGVYIEEAGGLVPLTQELSTVLPAHARPVPIAVTPLTRVAALHARNLIASGSDVASAIRTASLSVNMLFGDFDVVHAIPGTPENPGDVVSAQHTAILIALSQYAVTNGFTSQDFAVPFSQFLAPANVSGTAPPTLPNGQPVTPAFFTQALVAAAQQFAVANPSVPPPILPTLNPGLLPEP